MNELTLRIPAPSEKQLLMLTDKHRYVAYGGGNGFPDTAAEACYAIIRLLNEA